MDYFVENIGKKECAVIKGGIDVIIKKRRRIVLIGFAVLAAVSIIMFVVASLYIAAKSNAAISQVGELYTNAMAEQVKQKFDAVVSMQLSQLKGIVEGTPPEEAVYGKELLNELAESARVRNFTYLGLYTEDGECEIIYGRNVEYYDEVTFYNVLRNNKRRVFSGYNSKGEKMLCMINNAE